MRALGAFFAVVGLVWGVVAFNMTTTVIIASDVGEMYYSSRLERNMSPEMKYITSILQNAAARIYFFLEC